MNRMFLTIQMCFPPNVVIDWKHVGDCLILTCTPLSLKKGPCENTLTHAIEMEKGCSREIKVLINKQSQHVILRIVSTGRKI